MTIDPITRMLLSLAAIVLMFVTNFLVLFSRKMANAFVRFLFKAIAFVLLLVILMIVVFVLFF